MDITLPPEGLIGENRVVSEPKLGHEGIPTSGHVKLGDTIIEFEPVAWAPVLLTDPDNGSISRFPRGLVSIQTDDGRDRPRMDRIQSTAEVKLSH